MTQEEKNIKICEALGWTIHDTSTGFGRHKDAAHSATIPNHFTDLNACHEMEKVLNDEQAEVYCAHLCEFANSNRSSRWDCTHATAAQRAEAFGLTLNLWKQEN